VDTLVKFLDFNEFKAHMLRVKSMTENDVNTKQPDVMANKDLLD
jgi:hypothetical protein